VRAGQGTSRCDWPGPEETAELCRRWRDGQEAKRLIDADPERKDLDRLRKRVEDGRRAGDELLVGHRRLVRDLVAKALAGSGRPDLLEDALQEGSMAFLRACERWRPELGTLATLAAYTINDAVGRTVRGATLLSGSAGGALGARIVRFVAWIEANTGEAPSAEEIARSWNRTVIQRRTEAAAKRWPDAGPDDWRRLAVAGARRSGHLVRPADVVALLAQQRHAASLDAPIDAEEPATLADLIPGSPSAEDAVLGEDDIRKDAVRNAWAGLSDAERVVLSCQFGIGVPRTSLSWTAKTLGVKRAEVDFIALRAIRHLRELIIAESEKMRTSV
jgi:RNA polymerase sigma factor (sigma-70 family)